MRQIRDNANRIYTPPLAAVPPEDLDEPPKLRCEVSRLLTPREADVTPLVGRGLSNKEIANELDLSECTVKIYMKSILQKFNCRNRVELALMHHRVQFEPYG